jgi:hypothetical protein
MLIGGLAEGCSLTVPITTITYFVASLLFRLSALQDIVVGVDVMVSTMNAGLF